MWPEGQRFKFVFSLYLFIELAFLNRCAYADGPNLTNLTENEIKHALIYYKYSVTEHAVPGSEAGGFPDHNFIIPLPERTAGITYVGHAARLRLFLERAHRGDILRVGTLGGSITTGQGVGGGEHTYAKDFIDWLNYVMPPRPKLDRRLTQIAHEAHITGGGISRGRSSSSKVPVASIVAQRRRGRQRRALRSYKDARKRRHDFINGAVAGTESGYSSSCLHHHLISDPDLVFIEYAVNDHPTALWRTTGPSRRAMERLVRKVLNLPSRPAVVLVNMFALGPSSGKYWYTAERDFMEFATYYSLPAVSLKAAVLPSAYVGAAEEMSLGAIFNGGRNHPGRGGHVVVTELLITMCLDLLHSNHKFTGASSDSKMMRNSQSGAGSKELGALEVLAARPLPPPMAVDNFESANQTCYIEDELQSLVVEPIEGWEWTDEGRGKWGYVATMSKKTIRIKLNTQLAGTRSDDQRSARIIVQIAYLQSYRGMGTAQVACVEGCECENVKIDAYDSREASIIWMKDIKVSQHPDCIMQLTSGPPSQAAVRAANNATAAGVGGLGGGGESILGHKFKLMGVVVGEEPEASRGELTFVRGESHNIWRKTRSPRVLPNRLMKEMAR